ncbi:MAG: glycosyl hydrolase family 2 [Tannerellaceae bacterium]|jgi:hypothetical protein|nr:glycosyl hydrolase family 2 [Tannerellaceae bacterium]
MGKRFFIYLILFISFLFSCNTYTEDAEWPEITKEMKPWTRWWWMGSAVDRDNLTCQMEAFAKAGIGGVEITPVYGVKGEEDRSIDFLSPEWMRMLSYTQSVAGRLGMGVDMNMGTGWPYGGPSVTLDDAATKAVFENGQLTIGKTRQQVKRAAPGGSGYVLDHLNAGAVKRYIDVFDNAFSSSQTNYPNSFFNDSYEVYGADWTPELLNEFERRKGYRLQDYFTELLNDGNTDTSARIISDYREVTGELLRENFTEQWTERANAKGVKTRNQAHGSPANLIDIYASVDIPECESFGITDFDIPLLRKDSIRKENDGDPTALKFASSAAHITGKRYTSAETFTWLTEHFRTSLSQCKPEIDQMFVSGVNHVYFHGTAYSPKDAEWPGWKFYASVDMSPANTIWRDAPAFFRYITRVQSFLQYGMPDNDFLLYLPMYDIWHEQRGGYFQTFPVHGMREKLPDFYATVSHIKENGYDVDYISDRYIQTAGTEHGLIKTPGGTTYKALIIPAVKLMPLQTLEKIMALAKEGAKIIFTGQYPSDVPGFSLLAGRRDSLANLLAQLPKEDNFGETGIRRFGKGTILTGSDYKELFDSCRVEPEPFKTHFGGEYIRRAHRDGYHYFFTMLQNKEVDGWTPLAVEAAGAMLFDPVTGKSGKAQIRKGVRQTEVYLQLKPGESIILKTFNHKHTDAPEWAYYKESGEKFALADNWKMSFIESDPAIKGNFRLPALGSWTGLADDSLAVNRGTARYQTSFLLNRKNKEQEYRLCLGDVRESARVYVNGTWVGALFSVPFHVNIGAYLKEGENRIEIEVTNLPANRIADYDKRDVHWRKFHDINFVNIAYNNTRFDTWTPMPSGLLGPVVIKVVKAVR